MQHQQLPYMSSFTYYTFQTNQHSNQNITVTAPLGLQAVFYDHLVIMIAPVMIVFLIYRRPEILSLFGPVKSFFSKI